MKAAILYTQNQPLVIEDLSLPPLEYGQVLVELVASGLCGSQVLEITGKRGKDLYLPHTLGHEGSGIVLECGPGVTKVKPGDHVVLSWIKGSGIEAPSPRYKTSSHVINSGPITTFQTHSIVSENRITPIAPKIPLEEAALIGCAVSTGLGIALHEAELKPHHSIAVFGVGGIGLNVIQGASLCGTRLILAVDIYNHKLEMAKTLVATHVIRSDLENGIDIIFSLTEGKGVDFAIECAGTRQTMENAFKVTKPKGGKTILAGNLQKGSSIEIDPFDLILGKNIVGTWGGKTNPDRDFPKYLQWYMEGKLKLKELISHRFPLGDINHAFDALRRGEILRSIIYFKGPSFGA